MSWIKLETHTFDKVEIYLISKELGIDPDSALGKCCRVWAWFDANTTDGVTQSVTKALLDRYCGVTGFCDAMIKAGWMDEAGDIIQLPYYDRHNSSSAKARCLGSKRQHKFKSNAKGNASSNAQGNDDALPKSSHREDKIREDINTLEYLGFDAFWKSYPKKVGKGDAEKAWKKIKPDASLQDKILLAIATAARSADWMKDAGQFIPHPATWLNGKRWEDSISGLALVAGSPGPRPSEWHDLIKGEWKDRRFLGMK